MNVHASGKPPSFVSIASYRDEYLPFTIDSCLANAVHPDRLAFGVCWQADESENLDRFRDDPRSRIRRYPYDASLGYGWARAEVQKLYAGEEYHLLIDSHTAFANGWDESLIAQLENKPGTKPLLTTSSPPFTFDERKQVLFPWAGDRARRRPALDLPSGFHLSGGSTYRCRRSASPSRTRPPP